MQYTVWRHGRQVGETDLGFIYRENRYRVGWFHPTEYGERLMPIATGVSPALRAEYIMGHDENVHADLLTAVDRCDALAPELELCGPSRTVIQTESIHFVDTQYLLSLPPGVDDDDVQLTPEEEAEIEDFVAEWNLAHPEVDQAIAEQQASEMPRYQIQVRLVLDMAVP